MACLADALSLAATTKLQEAGYVHLVSREMHDWADHMKRRDAFVFSHFDCRWSDPAGAQWIGIFKSKTKELAACLAWRLIENGDYLSMVESGHLYADDPAKWGHTFHDTGLRDRLNMSGRILSRGGIHSFEGGNGLSFYACTYALAEAIRQDVDVSAGIILPGTFLPFPWYGYWNRCDTTAHKWPNMSEPMKATLAWSAKPQLRKEAEDRLAFLHATDKDDLKTTASAYSRQQDTGK